MSASGISASGARIQGDDYQHVYAWSEALRLLRPEDDVVRVEVEAANSGNVDDVVVRRAAGSHRYSQVKYSVDASRPISHDWLTTCETERSTSPLQKFWKSWEQLRIQGAQPQMLLVTNRSLDTNDPALRLRSGRQGLLTPGLAHASPLSDPGKRRKDWAQHLGVTEDRLLEMLGHLELKTDYGPWSALVDVTAERMAALGLRADEEAVYCGASSIRSRVTQGLREIDRNAMERELDRWRLRGGKRSATLLVQAIDWDSWPDASVAKLDWVDRFVGSEPRSRRQLRDPSEWNGRLRPEMVAAAASIKGQGYDRIFVKGAMRLTTWFLAGAELPDVRGHQVACSQKGELWSSEGEPEACPLTISSTRLSQGDDLAVGLSVSASIGPEVVRFLKKAAPVRSYVDIAPAAGAGPSAITGAAHAKGWALAVREAVRTSAAKIGARRVHLFMAAPAGCALLLGHYWNRLPETQLYEDLNPGYCPSYTVPG